MNRLNNYRGIIKLGVLFIAMPSFVCLFSAKRTLNLQHILKEQIREIGLINSDTIQDINIKSIGVTNNNIKNGTILHDLTLLMAENNITIERYTPYLISQEAGFELYAGEFLINGEFIPLTRFLAEIEKINTNSNIISIEYKIKELPQNNQQKLQMNLILQQIINPN